MSVTAGSCVWTGDSRQPMRGKLVLGKLLKSGGAGSVYLMPASPLQVAKIYHDSANPAHYERKIAAMLELSPHLPDLVENNHRYVQIAWPQALLRDERGRFLGFLMPAVDVQATSELECIMQERQARKAGLPTGLGAKITLAANLAGVIAALHEQGHHVIDLKPVNLRFYPQALYMAMLDCDGFSIQGHGERFEADQITPDYLAPEFQGRALPEGGETQQDLFALAVVVFQLLNFGIHPFSGRPNSDHVPTDIPGRIAQRCYAYGLHANPVLGPSPVSGHRSMPAELRLLFDRAFESSGATRPSANEWVVLLKAYALRSSQRLIVCAANHEHQHFAGYPCAACARVALIANTSRAAQAARSVLSRLQVPQSLRLVPRSSALRVPHFTRPQPTTPPASHAHAKGWAAPTPPRPPRPALLTGRSLSWKMLKFIFFVIFIIARVACTGRAATLPPRAIPDSAATPATVHDWATIPTRLGVESAKLDVETAVQAMLLGTPYGDAAMSRLRAAASARPVAPANSGMRTSFALFSTSLSASETQFMTLLDERLAAIAKSPYDGELAYELGWLSLVVKERDAASGWFLRAIWANPDEPKGWYGFGATSTADQETVGAMAIAEKIARNTDEAQRMREDFRPEVISLAAMDSTRFTLLQARAHRIAADRSGGSAPGDLQEWDQTPLPQR